MNSLEQAQPTSELCQDLTDDQYATLNGYYQFAHPRMMSHESTLQFMDHDERTHEVHVLELSPMGGLNGPDLVPILQLEKFEATTGQKERITRFYATKSEGKSRLLRYRRSEVDEGLPELTKAETEDIKNLLSNVGTHLDELPRDLYREIKKQREATDYPDLTDDSALY